MWNMRNIFIHVKMVHLHVTGIWSKLHVMEYKVCFNVLEVGRYTISKTDVS